MKILFICTGNTCRSPMAAAVFNNIVMKKNINAFADSTGISTVAGLPATENAVLALEKTGIDLSNHLSKPVTPELLNESDKIICITKSHMNAILSSAPELSGKCSVLGNGIDDPYGMPLEEYIITRDEISSAVKKLVEEISNDDKEA